MPNITAVKRGYWTMMTPARDLDGYQRRNFRYPVEKWGELIKDGWSKKCPAIWAIWPGQRSCVRDGNHRLQAAIESSPELLVPVLMVCQRKLWDEIYEKVSKGNWVWEGDPKL